jgi:DNA polymerase-3 subunit alpha
MITLLTPSGVVTVKFYKGQFGFYDQQLSQINDDGTKTVLEKSWFSRGTKLLITGYRRGDQFVPKKYKDSAYKHSLQLIKEINGEEIRLQSARIGEEDDEY